MKTMLLVCLMLAPSIALGCTCLGTASIEQAVADNPILVEARVVSLEESNTPEYGRQVLSVTLRVQGTHKGSVETESIVVESSMCYSSLYPELMKVDHVYVLPLSDQIDGRYSLAGCSHSGMELIGSDLFTFEQSVGADRKLQRYKSYSEFLSEISSSEGARQKEAPCSSRRRTPLAANQSFKPTPSARLN